MVNISYNRLRIGSALSDQQVAAFDRLVLLYNLAYPACVYVLYLLVKPVYVTYQRLGSGVPVTSHELAVIRQRLVRWSLLAVAVSCVGWLPGGVLFPLVLEITDGPLHEGVPLHFLISFTISGLIAMLCGEAEPRKTARRELRGVARRLRLFQFLAGVIPLAGAVLMVGMGPEDNMAEYRTFRILVTGLIGLGMAGFGLALLSANVLSETLTVLTGAQGERRVRPIIARPTTARPTPSQPKPMDETEFVEPPAP